MKTNLWCQINDFLFIWKGNWEQINDFGGGGGGGGGGTVPRFLIKSRNRN